MIESGLNILEQEICGLVKGVVNNTIHQQVLYIVHTFWSRGNWSVRFDEDNTEALCYGCHSYLGGNPVEFHKYYLEKLGQERFDALEKRKNTPKSGSIKYYKSKEFRLTIKRKNERVGRLVMSSFSTDEIINES